MPQISRPTSDVTEGGWTPVPIAPELDLGLVVASSVNPQGDTFEVHIADLASPETNMPQTMSITLQKTCADCMAATVSLVKGTTIIGQWTVTLTNQWQTYTFPLTPAQISLINGDYTNLRVRVSAGPCPSSSSSSGFAETTGCSCCPNGAPLTWVLTCSGVANGSCINCNSYNGTFNLVFQGISNGSCSWITDPFHAICPGGVGPVWQLLCNTSTGAWKLSTASATASATYVPSGTFNCLGPNTFILQSTTNDCTGWPSTITITPG